MVLYFDGRNNTTRQMIKPVGLASEHFSYRALFHPPLPRTNQHMYNFATENGEQLAKDKTNSKFKLISNHSSTSNQFTIMKIREVSDF